jgi:hypothetical protein
MLREDLLLSATLILLIVLELVETHVWSRRQSGPRGMRPA